VAEELTQIPYENIIRAYIAETTTDTSLYQALKRGEKRYCGYNIRNLKVPTNGKLKKLMVTPSTKSDEHDISVDPRYLIVNEICTRKQFRKISKTSLAAFKKISDYLDPRNIILVDTKLEHGINSKGEIVSQDEIFTMDSSRYWKKDDYEQQLAAFNRGLIEKIDPKSYSKEFARGFSKGEDGYTEEQRIEIAVRYIMGIQELTGERFEPDTRSEEERTVTGLQEAVKILKA